jgi:hypothetical protein
MTSNGSGLGSDGALREARKLDQLGCLITSKNKPNARQTQARALSRRRDISRRRAAFAREIAFAEFKEKRAGWVTLSRLVWGRS